MAKTTKRNRRPLNPAQQWRPQLIVVDADNSNLAAGVLTVPLPVPMFGPVEDVEWEASGSGGPFLSDSAYLTNNGSELNVVFTGMVAGESYQITIPPWDPAFRTTVGGYLAPVIITLENQAS